MSKRYLAWLILPLAAFIAIAGCEGPEGPAGPAGPKGDKGDPVSQYSYLGDNVNTCAHCHAGKVDQWLGTGHFTAYADLDSAGRNNLYCLHCHTTGFDSEVTYGDTIIFNPGPNKHGFDDYFPPKNAEDSLRWNALKGVQCEVCHGSMGPTIYDHSPKVNFATNLDAAIGNQQQCGACHDQYEEWLESGHGKVLETHGQTPEEFTAEWGRTACDYCHTAEGFVRTYDPDHANSQMPEVYNIVGCATCHDPHSDGVDKQLRTTAAQTVLYSVRNAAKYENRGSSQTCVQCHHARRDSTNVHRQISNGTAHFGPHASAQMDMFLGSGSYEIDGYTYDRGDGVGHKASIQNACVDCHMTKIQVHGRDYMVHKFEAEVSSCQRCHAGATNFDINGKVTEINALMDSLLTIIGVPIDSLGSRTATSADERKAAYAYKFVYYDGSHGVHNYKYAKSLLVNAIDYARTLP